VGFEPTIPAFEQAKTVHAFDRAATVIGYAKKLPSSILEPGYGNNLASFKADMPRVY
jgi:hypothetical protein